MSLPMSAADPWDKIRGILHCATISTYLSMGMSGTSSLVVAR